MLLARSTQLEIMDDASINDERIDAALRELRLVSKWLGGRSASRGGVRWLLRRAPSGNELSVLDVGAGGSDLAEALAALRRSLLVTALDINERACEYSRRMSPATRVIRGSVFDLTNEGEQFDIIHASLFFHHLTDAQLRALLPVLLSRARLGIVINDLRRSGLSWMGIALLTRLFSRSEMVKHDAPLSVHRGFSRKELVELTNVLPHTIINIRRRWAFRWLVCIAKP